MSCPSRSLLPFENDQFEAIVDIAAPRELAVVVVVAVGAAVVFVLGAERALVLIIRLAVVIGRTTCHSRYVLRR